MIPITGRLRAIYPVSAVRLWAVLSFCLLLHPEAYVPSCLCRLGAPWVPKCDSRSATATVTVTNKSQNWELIGWLFI